MQLMIQTTHHTFVEIQQIKVKVYQNSSARVNFALQIFLIL